MFGRGRFNPGVIIDPKPEFAFDPEDQEKLAEFRNKIWCVNRRSRITNAALGQRAYCPWVCHFIAVYLIMVPTGRRLNG